MINELTKPRVVPLELFSKGGRRLPDEIHRIKMILTAAVWRIQDGGYPRTGMLDAAMMEREDLATPQGLTSREAICEARRHLMSTAQWRRGASFLVIRAEFRYNQASYIHWECRSDDDVIHYSLMGRWAFRIKHRLLPLLGWEEVPTSPGNSDDRRQSPVSSSTTTSTAG